MIRFTRHQRLLQFFRYKRTSAQKTTKETRIALPQNAVEKIKQWQKMLKDEIEEDLSMNREIKNLKFKRFAIDPTGGNHVEFHLPPNARSNLDEIQYHFKRSAWVDLHIGDKELSGYFLEIDEDTIKLRIMDVPPISIYDENDITVSLSDDRSSLDFLLDFWEGNKWRESPGATNFLRAYYALPMSYGTARDRVKFINPKLDPSQRHAVGLAMSSKQSLLSIQGPPGTGKTDVVAEIILQYYRANRDVLLLAPSNKAVDNAAERVHRLMNNNNGIHHYSLNPATGSTPSSPFSLRDAINSHKGYQRLEEACEKTTDFWDLGIRGTKEARLTSAIRDEICTDLIGKANVIYSTLTASHVRKLKTRKFKPDLVIIDEAAQASEPLCWFGMLQAERAVIVGDQHQLGSTFKSERTCKSTPEDTVMSYLSKEFRNEVQVRLKTQYRSNEKIMMWSNNTFYDGEVCADESVRNSSIKDLIDPVSTCYTDPLILIDTQGAGRKFHERRAQTSFTNFGEAMIIEEQVRALVKSGLSPKMIGVISPYRSQVEHIRRLLSDMPQLAISSVDAFQGRECEVICMSLVRSKSEQIELGFLIDLRRMNVSVTRAKRQFFLVSNSDTMKEKKELNDLLNVIEEHGRVVKLSSSNQFARSRRSNRLD